MKTPFPRRQFLKGTLATLAVGCAPKAPDPSTDRSEPRPPSDTDRASCPATTTDIQGPFYVAGVPVRSDLDRYGDPGEHLALSGTLTDTNCTPIADAVVEIWQADPEGAYDNGSDEKRYRGQLSTDVDGSYAFSTLKPGSYLNGSDFRPAHIHMKVWIGGVSVLTTQIYFEGDPYLAGDAWAEPGRTIPLQDDGEGGWTGQFDVSISR